MGIRDVTWAWYVDNRNEKIQVWYSEVRYDEGRWRCAGIKKEGKNVGSLPGLSSAAWRSCKKKDEKMWGKNTGTSLSSLSVILLILLPLSFYFPFCSLSHFVLSASISLPFLFLLILHHYFAFSFYIFIPFMLSSSPKICWWYSKADTFQVFHFYSKQTFQLPILKIK